MERKRVIRAGALFIATIVITIWGYSYLKNNNLFTTSQIFYGVYEEINGLSEGNAVYMNGLKIGQVRRVDLLNNSLEQLVVEFLIDKDIKLPNSAIAQISDVDIMGTKCIRITFPSGKTTDMLQSGDTLKTDLEEGLKAEVNRQILPIKLKAEELMGSLDSVVITVQALLNDETRANLSKSFVHIKTTLENLEHTTFTFDTLMTTQKTKMSAIISNTASITENFKNNNERISNVLKNFSSISDTLAKANIARTLRNTDNAISQFSGIVAKINSGQGSAGQLIYNDTLYQNLENASKDLDLLVKDLKQNPRRYVRFSVIDVGVDKKKEDEK